jgi:antitoxin component of MazEF toxin-antitoxin module
MEADDEIVLQPNRQKPTLENLLAGITPENCHDEISFEKLEGNEWL